MKKAIIRALVCFIPITKTRRRIRKKLIDIYVNHKIRKYKEIKEQWLVQNNGNKLLPGRFSEYDLVFAIGAACPMTSELVAHKLRTFSTPFDWTDSIPDTNWLIEANIWRDTRFLVKINALCSGFVGFFNQDDIKIVSNPVPLEHHNVYNIKTKIRFLHLFPGNKSICGEWDNISFKMKSRGERLIEKIKSSKRVLICWGHRMLLHRDQLDATISDEDIKTAVRLLHDSFPNTDIDIVFFEHDETKKDFEYEKIMVCNWAYRIKSNHYVTTRAYDVVCEDTPNISFGESAVVAEMLDNIKVSGLV